MDEHNFLTRPEDQLNASIEGLKTSDSWSFHVFNSVTGSKNGFLEIAISKDMTRLQNWQNKIKNYPEYHKEVSVKTIVSNLSELDLGAETILLDDRFAIIGGEGLKLFDYGDGSFTYIGLSTDRIVLIRHSVDWAEIEEHYGTYLRPTKH